MVSVVNYPLDNYPYFHFLKQEYLISHQPLPHVPTQITSLGPRDRPAWSSPQPPISSGLNLLSTLGVGPRVTRVPRTHSVGSPFRHAAAALIGRSLEGGLGFYQTPTEPQSTQPGYTAAHMSEQSGHFSSKRSSHKAAAKPPWARPGQAASRRLSKLPPSWTTGQRRICC